MLRLGFSCGLVLAVGLFREALDAEVKPHHALNGEEDFQDGSPRRTIWRARGVKVIPERADNVRHEGHVCVLPPGVDAFRGAPIEHTLNASFLLVDALVLFRKVRILQLSLERELVEVVELRLELRSAERPILQKIPPCDGKTFDLRSRPGC